MSTDVISVSDRPARSTLLRAGLVTLNVVAIAGIALAVHVGRPRFFGMALIALLSVVLFDGLIATDQRRVQSGYDTLAVILADRRVLASSFLLAVTALLLAGRGLVFVSAAAVLFGVLVVRILETDYERTSVAGDLVAVAASGVLVVLGQSLTVAYYARTFDTIYHTALTRRIAAAGSLNAIAATRYDALAVLHTHASLGVRMTGIPPRTYLAIFLALSFALATVAVFVTFRNITDSATIGLLGAVLLAFNPEFVRWGTQAHAQSLSFVFLTVFLVLLSKGRRDWRLGAMTGVVAVAWVMTHHLSIAMGVALLGVPVVAGVLGARAVGNVDAAPAAGRYVVLVGAAGIYWFLTGLYRQPIRWIFEVSPAASSGIPTSQFLIQRFSDPVALGDAAVPFVLNELHYMFVLGLAGLAIWRRLRTDTPAATGAFLLAAVSFSAAVVLYVPNPAWIPLRGVATLNRWGIMTLPFVLLVPAFGLRRLARRSSTSMGTLVVLVLVVAMAFTSVGGGYSDPSTAELAGYEKGAQGYFTTENLAAAEFVVGHRDTAAVYGTSLVPGYLQYESWTGTAGGPPDGFSRVTVEDDVFVYEPGLTVIQGQAFRDDTVKVVVRPETEPYNGEVAVNVPVSDETASLQDDRHDVVYSDGDTVVVAEPPADGEDDESDGGS